MAKTEQNPSCKRPRYSWFLRRQVALEYLESTKTLGELSIAYGVPAQTICRWVHSYSSDLQKRKVYNFNAMTAEEQKQYNTLKQENERLRQMLEAGQDEALKQQNASLKKELEFAQMKAKAMETIIDLAKEELGIDLRKNSGARQPVKLKKTTLRQK